MPKPKTDTVHPTRFLVEVQRIMRTTASFVVQANDERAAGELAEERSGESRFYRCFNDGSAEEEYEALSVEPCDSDDEPDIVE